MLMVYHLYNIIIGRIVGSPGNSIEVFYGLNAVDKNFLSTEMSKKQFPISRGFGNHMEINTSTNTEDGIIAREFHHRFSEVSGKNYVIDQDNYIKCLNKLN